MELQLQQCCVQQCAVLLPCTLQQHSCTLCRDEYLAMGILHVTNAVSFLNNDCKMVWWHAAEPLPHVYHKFMCQLCHRSS